MDLKAIASSIIDTVKSQAKAQISTVVNDAKDFWDSNKAAQDFVVERAERLAQLSLQYGLAVGDQKDAIKAQMDLVQSTIETELLAVALDGQEAAKATFRNIVSTVVATMVKVLPMVLSAI